MRIKTDVFSPLFFFPMMFCIVFFCGHLFTEQYFTFLGKTPPSSQYLYYSIALFFYLLGSLSYPFFLKMSSRPRMLPPVQQISSKRFWFFTLPVLFVSITALAFRLSVTGIPFINFEPDFGRTMVNRMVGGYVSVLSLTSQVAMVFLFVYRFILGKKGTVINLLILTTLVGLILLGSRNRILMPLLLISIIYHYMIKRFTLKQMFLIGMGLVALFTFYGFFRSSSIEGRWENWAKVFELPESFHLLLPLILAWMNPSLIFSLITLNIPQNAPFQQGHFLASGLLAILPGHQPNQGTMIKDLLNMVDSNSIAVSMLGTFWIDFGILGLIVGMFLVGFSLRFLYFKMIFSQYRFSWCLLYAYFVLYFCQTLYSGFLEAFTDYWFPLLFLIGSVYMERKEQKYIERSCVQ